MYKCDTCNDDAWIDDPDTPQGFRACPDCNPEGDESL